MRPRQTATILFSVFGMLLDYLWHALLPSIPLLVIAIVAFTILGCGVVLWVTEKEDSASPLLSVLRLYRSDWSFLRDRISVRSLSVNDSDVRKVKEVGDQMRVELANFKEKDFKQGVYDKLQSLITDIQSLGIEIQKAFPNPLVYYPTRPEVEVITTRGDELQKRVEHMLLLLE